VHLHIDREIRNWTTMQFNLEKKRGCITSLIDFRESPFNTGRSLSGFLVSRRIFACPRFQEKNQFRFDRAVSLTNEQSFRHV
jgi:hypothetical protein